MSSQLICYPGTKDMTSRGVHVMKTKEIATWLLSADCCAAVTRELSGNHVLCALAKCSDPQSGCEAKLRV